MPGRYAVQVSFPGFETLVMPDVRVRAGENKRDAVLAIQKLDESVSVGRDKATVASDPNNDRFNTVLSRDQINALPDDPDEMERVLKEMAGPGATLRVDGFRGGKLPPKSQIRSIRFSRDMYAAENHAAGMVFVDIVTQPGLGPLRGSMDFLFRDDALNARNAYVTGEGTRADAAVHVQPEWHAAKGADVVLALGDRGVALRFRQHQRAQSRTARSWSRRSAAPRTGSTSTAGSTTLSPTSHTLRANLQSNGNEQANLGVGGYELADRAFSRTTDDTLLRLSE